MVDAEGVRMIGSVRFLAMRCGLSAVGRGLSSDRMTGVVRHALSTSEDKDDRIRQQMFEEHKKKCGYRRWRWDPYYEPPEGGEEYEAYLADLDEIHAYQKDGRVAESDQGGAQPKTDQEKEKAHQKKPIS